MCRETSRLSSHRAAAILIREVVETYREKGEGCRIRRVIWSVLKIGVLMG